MKKVAFIARKLTRGGVGRFIHEILSELNANKPKDVDLHVVSDDQDLFNTYPNLTHHFLDPKPLYLWDYVYLLKVLRALSPDEVIYTKNIIPLTHKYTKWYKKVIIYDLGFYHPQLNAYPFADTLYMKSMLPPSIAMADAIYAISKFTKSEVVKFAKANPQKIKHLPLAASSEFKKIKSATVLAKLTKKYQLHLPFIFYCGSISPRKNILRLIQAFQQVVGKIPHHLYLVSGKQWNMPHVVHYLQKNHINTRVHLLPYVPDDELVAMYSFADAFMYPSLYEGFGLPILEAQACQCPVLTSNASACKEAAGLGAILVNPYQTSAIAKGIIEVTKNKQLRALLIQNGMKNIKSYSWKQSVRILLGSA